MRSNRASIMLATFIVALLVLTGCQNLPRRTAGAKCPVVGEHAQDGTWVLKCGANKRWTKLMTIAAANDAVANWLRSQVPPTAPPPPPTAPPAPTADTAFSAVTSVLVGTGAHQIAPGDYFTTVTTTACGISTAGLPQKRRLAAAGPMFFSLAAGERVSAAGPCTWRLGLPATQPIPASGDGMYRVGNEIQPGLYTTAVPAGPECYWETSTRIDGSIAAISDNYYGSGPQLAVIDSNDKVFTSSGCGNWIYLPGLPATYVEYIGSYDNWVFAGQRGFHQAGQFTTQRYPASNPPSFQVVAGGFNFTIGMPASGSLALATYPLTNSPTVNGPSFSLSGQGHSCTPSGTFTVHELNVANDGVPNHISFTALGECEDGEPFGVRARVDLP